MARLAGVEPAAARLWGLAADRPPHIIPAVRVPAVRRGCPLAGPPVGYLPASTCGVSVPAASEIRGLRLQQVRAFRPTYSPLVMVLPEGARHPCHACRFGCGLPAWMPPGGGWGLRGTMPPFCRAARDGSHALITHAGVRAAALVAATARLPSYARKPVRGSPGSNRQAAWLPLAPCRGRAVPAPCFISMPPHCITTTRPASIRSARFWAK